jgi:ubiquinone/menaquinone biosynthesis C-methylase UbiE
MSFPGQSVKISGMNEQAERLKTALWRVYNRPERPQPWASGGNLPWDEPEFAARMLREHLDESHGAASRTAVERQWQLDWLWDKLALRPGGRVLDLTCGPGFYAVELAKRGCEVTAVDFSPAAIPHARQLAEDAGVTARCQFIQADVREVELPADYFDAALLIYGQLAVFTRADAQAILHKTRKALRSDGRLLLELLNPARIDKKNSSWWYTGSGDLWGDAPFLHLGERLWYEEEQLSLERFQIIHLETGQMDEVQLCDQAYTPEEINGMLQTAGFHSPTAYPAWDNLPLYDAAEWLVYLGQLTADR